MKNYIKFLSPVVFLLSLFLILFVKSTPSGKLWKEYSVLYVQKSAEDSTIMEALASQEIKGVVAYSSQYIPSPYSENSVEISMLRLSSNNSNENYLSKRNAFFFDKSDKYRLYYIPAEYKAQLEKALHLLNSRGIECGTDSNATYPFLIPLIALLLAGMLFLFSKNKTVFACGAVLPVLFLYSNPFYPVALADCLVFLIIFIASNLWKRKDAFKVLLSRTEIPAMLVIALLAAFSGSILSGFIFIICALGTAGSLFTYYYLEAFLRNKKSFVPVYIRSAKRVSIFAGKTFTIMSIVSAAAVLFIGVFFLSSSSAITSHVSKLLLPANTRDTNEYLPQFEDYYNWYWELMTKPYVSLNDNGNTSGSEAETVEFSHFIEQENNGAIIETKNIMTFDNNFRDSIYAGIDGLKFNAVEKVMKSEGKNFSAGYSPLSSYQINIFGIIMMFICLFILLFIYFSIIIRKGINK